MLSVHLANWQVIKAVSGRAGFYSTVVNPPELVHLAVSARCGVRGCDHWRFTIRGIENDDDS